MHSRMCHQHVVQTLGWESLQNRCYLNRLSNLFRIQHGLVDMNTKVIQPNDSRTRGSQRLNQQQASKNVYKYSFFPLTIGDWNQLPTSVANIQTLHGRHRQPAFFTPAFQLENQKPVHSFNGGHGYFICFIGHHSFILGRTWFNFLRVLGVRQNSHLNQAKRNTLEYSSILYCKSSEWQYVQNKNRANRWLCFISL